MKKNSFGKFYLVLLVFILPMIGSWLLYHYHDHFHLKTVNHGTLVSPPINIEYLYSGMENGHDKAWRIIHIHDGVCDEACQRIDYQLGQIKKVFGKDQQRIRVISMGGKDAALARFQEDFTKSTQQIVVANKILLVDPQGNFFMYYPDTAKPMDILKDLKRPLEVSQIG